MSIKYDVMAVPDWVFIPMETAELKKLKKYVEEKGVEPTKGTETEFVLSALSWVSRQWKHDGMNEPPKSFHALEILNEVHQNNTRYRPRQKNFYLIRDAYVVCDLRTMVQKFGSFKALASILEVSEAFVR